MKIVVKEKYFNVRQTKYNRKIVLNFLKNCNDLEIQTIDIKTRRLGDEMSPFINTYNYIQRMEKYKVFQKIK